MCQRKFCPIKYTRHYSYAKFRTFFSGHPVYHFSIQKNQQLSVTVCGEGWWTDSETTCLGFSTSFRYRNNTTHFHCNIKLILTLYLLTYLLTSGLEMDSVYHQSSGANMRPRLQHTTSCWSTDSKRPHQCCQVAITLAHVGYSLYFTMGGKYPRNCPLLMGDLSPHQMHGFLGTPSPHSQTASQLIQPL